MVLNEEVLGFSVMAKNLVHILFCVVTCLYNPCLALVYVMFTFLFCLIGCLFNPLEVLFILQPHISFHCLPVLLFRV
jgi:hypothetical protein